MQNLVSYTRQPKRYQVSHSGTTNNDCRICKILDTTGDHEGSLYVGHYGNYPSHCPWWAEMDQNEGHRITQKAGFCHRCLNPTFTFKAGPELQKHHLTDCYVSKTNKHKYSCLNRDCLKHSWVCLDHTEENKPLFDTHCKEMADKKQNIVFSFVTLSPPTNLPSEEQRTAKTILVQSSATKPENWVSNQDKLPGFWSPRENSDLPNNDPEHHATRFEDITVQDPTVPEPTQEEVG